MRLIAACLARDWRLAATHRAALIIDGAAVVTSALVFYYLSRFVGRGDSYFAFALAGLAVLRMHAGVPRVLQATTARIADGTLEILLSGAHRPAVVVVAEALYELLRGLVLSATLVLVAVVLLGADVHVGAGALAAVLLGLLGACGILLALAVALVALLLVLREAGAVSSLTGVLLPVLGGVYFPLRVLPQPLRGVAEALPFHVPVDVVRHGLLEGRVDGADAAILLGATVGSLGLAALLVGPAVAHARRASRLGLE